MFIVKRLFDFFLLPGQLADFVHEGERTGLVSTEGLFRQDITCHRVSAGTRAAADSIELTAAAAALEL